MIISNIKIKSVFAALLFSFLFCFPLFSQNLDFKIEKYSKVKIFFQSKDQVKQLAETGLIFDHATYEKNPAGGFNYTTVLNSRELEVLQKSGIQNDILVDDLVKKYNALAKLSAAEKDQIESASSLDGFEFGSMGGFYTNDEVIMELDSMRLLYPHLITEKKSIGLSLEGRELWMSKISDNPDLDEDEPEVLYDALHHAREPQGMMTLIYFMYYLLENYETDDEAAYLVNNRELYFVPVVNPDGYVYNEQTNPNGGGMWRKNRRDNGHDCYGVDLNRNYGYMWGYDDVGSSPYPASDCYRGPYAFSEPESQVMRDFCIDHYFILNLSYHTYSNVLIYPWCYVASPLNPDSTIYIEYADDMTQYNYYSYGNVVQTIGYTANGGSIDWMYGEQSTKNKILSMTPEVGSDADGFWPDESRIYPLAEENLYSNLFLAWAAGGFVKYKDYIITDIGNANGYVEAGETAEIIFGIKNIGQGEASNVTLSLCSSDPYITINTPGAGDPVNIPAQTKIYPDTFSFTMAANTPEGYAPQMTLEISTDGVVKTEAIKGIIVGMPSILFADDAESGAGNWTAGENWDTTTESFFSPEHSFTDSPSGMYNDNANNSLSLIEPVILSGADSIYLEFHAKWNIERLYDFARVQVSTDGDTWTSQKGLYTTTGSGKGVQTSGEPGYHGLQNEWIKEQINLSDYSDESQLYIRFNLISDGGVEKDGWYVDNIKLLIYDNCSSDVVLNETNIPLRYSLEQNYPNPFNPVTVIKYQLPAAADVEIKIFNMLGQEVKTLVDNRQTAGDKSVIWNGKNNYGQEVSSGIYLYRLQTDEYVNTKKLLLIR